MDGTLLGLIAAVAVLAGLAALAASLDCAFRLLGNRTRRTGWRNQRLVEQHLLLRSQQPNRLVPTQVAVWCGAP